MGALRSRLPQGMLHPWSPLSSSPYCGAASPARGLRPLTEPRLSICSSHILCVSKLLPGHQFAPGLLVISPFSLQAQESLFSSFLLGCVQRGEGCGFPRD